MIGYASRTGTRRNPSLLRTCGWRLLVSATGVWRTEGFKYALDNGAWTAYQQGTDFDADLFVGLVRKLGHGADWIAVPDIVSGGRESLEFSLSWLGRMNWPAMPLIPVQDGMHEADVVPHISVSVGLFIGGTTEFKESTAMKWGALAKSRGCYLHMGRVNSQRRIKIAATAGCDSFDGTAASRFSDALWPLDQARRQTHMDLT